MVLKDPAMSINNNANTIYQIHFETPTVRRSLQRFRQCSKTAVKRLFIFMFAITNTIYPQYLSGLHKQQQGTLKQPTVSVNEDVNTGFKFSSKQLNV